MPLLSATLIVCDRLLGEVNGVYTPVRILDLLEYDLLPDLPPERQTLPANILAMLRFNAEDDGQHTVQLGATRPDGTEANLGDALPIDLRDIALVRPSPIKSVMVTVDLRIVPRDGIHTIRLLLDGEEVARFAFAIARRVMTQATERESLQAAQDTSQRS